MILRFFFVLVIAASAGVALAATSLEVSTDSSSVIYERGELEAMPQITIRTISPYYEGALEFSGPSLAALIEMHRQENHTTVVFRALNNYIVERAIEEVLELDAIVATRREGRPLSVRSRGPYWIMLPISERPELDDIAYHRLMVWQLVGIELR